MQVEKYDFRFSVCAWVFFGERTQTANFIRLSSHDKKMLMLHTIRAHRRNRSLQFTCVEDRVSKKCNMRAGEPK